MALLVLALGNDLLGDDGIGLRAGDELEKKNILGVKVIKSGLSGLYLIDLIEGFDDLLIIDSIMGDEPGKVVHLKLSQLKPQVVPSAHYLGLPEALELARHSGLRMPKRVAIVAMQIANSQEIGSGMSEEAQQCLPTLIGDALSLISEWGYDVNAWRPNPSSESNRSRRA